MRAHVARCAAVTAAAIAVLGSCSSAPSAAKEPVSPTPASAGATAASTPASAPVVDAKRDHSDVAPAELTCKDVAAAAPGYCGVLENAPRADSASSQKAVEMFRRLEGPFHALSGRETALVVLAPEARIGEGDGAKPIPPAAYICPGAPPTVYVPASLLALIDNNDPKKYPDDFLAFVIGHELGHRMNDLTPDGCQLGAFQRPGKGANEEELADARSAFFITGAGFSASGVARDDMVSRFLEAEYALGREISKGRRESLLGALSRFDGYEALYQAALSVAMTGEMEAADRLLSWADELVQSHGVPLPELRVVRAIARIDRAAKMAPWLAELGMPVGIDHLRCVPVHPGHSGLWEEPDKRMRSPDIERGRKLLREALALLGEAELRGATPFTVAAARTCALLYLADTTAAEKEQARVERLVPRVANAAVKQALADNRALVSFASFAKARPVPPLENSSALDAWTDELAAAIGSRAPAGLAAIVSALRKPGASTAAPAGDAPACRDAKAKPPAALAAMPAAGQGHGQCPSGYRLVSALPSLDAAKQTGSQQGITVCRPTQGGRELVTVRLAATTEPPLAALERTMLTSPPPSGLAELSAWACHCASLERQGVSDRGEIVYRTQCPTLDVDRGVLVVVNGRVQSVIQHAR